MDEESQSKRRKKDASKKKEPGSTSEIVTRIRPPPIQSQDMAMICRPPVLQPVEDEFASSDGPQLYVTEDHPQNKKGFRYLPCKTTPDLTCVLYTAVEVEPLCARLSYEDRSPQVFISKDCTIASTNAGFRSVRANVGVRDGDWYYEVKILRGNDESGAHVRLGWTRREASLEAPVGHDAYGYGLRDVLGEKVHLSRPLPFMNESFSTGDVIGFWIRIPRDYSTTQVSRDRIPIRYKGQLYFECLSYVPTKQMDDLLVPNNPVKKNRPQKFVPTAIPGSFIRVFKNGKDMGVAFENLYEFLPPHSKFQANMGAADVDDGDVGYFPTISVFKGGMAKINFGPQFEYLPEIVSQGFADCKIKPLCIRYDEQVADDITYDVIDQVDYEILDRLEDERLAKMRAEQEKQRQLARSIERSEKVDKTEERAREPKMTEVKGETGGVTEEAANGVTVAAGPREITREVKGGTGEPSGESNAATN